jgi:hypothetical protein
MHASQQEFAEVYRNLPEEEIAALYTQIDTLADVARFALTAEIQRRGLTDTQLEKLRGVELRHEAQFDRLEKYRRKKLAFGRVGINDIRGWIVAILAALVLILISELIDRRH